MSLFSQKNFCSKRLLKSEKSYWNIEKDDSGDRWYFHYLHTNLYCHVVYIAT